VDRVWVAERAAVLGDLPGRGCAAVVDLVAPQLAERVVDFDAGMGPATVVAARTGASVLAVDPSSYMRRILGLRRLALARASP
jgi:2-polyprenyl-3-methyl-5-hydroxy-6-metoxy-1,4-benzoquinol methylase